MRISYAYTISDGQNYSVQTNLSITTTSAFATTKDQLGNPYQSVVSVTGTRVYTYLPTGQRLVSTVGSLTNATAAGLSADQRFYPYALLAAGPGVYSASTAPFLDSLGVAFSLSPAAPANGLAPGVGQQFNSTAALFSTTEAGAVLTEAHSSKPPLVLYQQQVYSLM